MEHVIRKLLPILLLLAVGFFAKKRKLFSEGFIQELKGLVVKIALPVVLFDAFSIMSLQASYLLLFVLIFIYCGVLYLFGSALHRFFPKVFHCPHTNAYMTGFEFGMIGVGLFGAIWGMDKLPVIMLIAFGHEIFIWFFYVHAVSKSDERIHTLKATFMQFVTTPAIVAIILGIAVNLSGIRSLMIDTVIGQSLHATIEFIKPLTAPLILIVVGYTMVFQLTRAREAAAYVFTRIVLTLALGSLILLAVIRYIPGLDTYFVQSFYAFILLPPSYILPLYIKDQKEAVFFTQLLLYSTMLSFIGYGILVWFSF